MDSSGGRLNAYASICQQPRFPFDNSSTSLASNDNKNEDRNWGLFEFDSGVESPKQSLTPYYTSSFISTNLNQFLDPHFFSFNPNIVSSSGNYSGFHFKEEKKNVSGLNFKTQTRPTSSSISGNKKEESIKRQILDWNVESQPKQIDFAMDISKNEPEPVQSAQIRSNFDYIQATKDQSIYQDGYNWRKYGQKQVKRSNTPQSYYKCTYPNCTSKKKVEKDLYGFITKIIYKEKHNHTMPHNVKKSSSNSFTNTIFEHSNKHVEPYSECSFIEDEQEQGSSICKYSIGHENEPEAKRWKLDEVESEAAFSIGNNTVQEPRLVIETKSDIDILDDGYKWKKYGQKVVKGNPNPRSYYKCTYTGCQVRKLVERASHDFQTVITTYEAKHNHGVPTPRRGASYAINEPSTSTTTTTSNNCGPMISRPLPKYSNNFHGTKGLTASQTHVLQALENSGNYGYSGKILSESITGELVSTTKEEPEIDFIFNSLLD